MSAVPTSGALGAPAASGSSFYAAMRILPAAQREAMYSVYAFCRAVDDIADDGGPERPRLEGLDRWRRDIGRLYAGGGETELTAGLRSPIETFRLKQLDFLAVIEGMEMDVRQAIRAPDWQTLDLYCDRVASAVGRLCVKIFGIDDDSGVPLAHHLGRALQMTNILRDLDEDAAIGRLYLPREALSEAGITDHDVDKVLASPMLDQACRIVAARARTHFDEAERIMARCERNSVRSPRLMAAVYRPMLGKLVARGWSPPRHKLRHSTPLILWAVLRYGLL
jgi:presqualene diphosphate synthase